VAGGRPRIVILADASFHTVRSSAQAPEQVAHVLDRAAARGSVALVVDPGPIISRSNAPW
jgi:hypothetical protein